MRNVEKLVAQLRQLVERRQLGPYITHIRFPRFKNIQRNTRIEFSFPITALVGPNGCGKTSALHALYGAPLGKSTSDYWFTTDVDPIKEGQGEPNRFIYGHVLAGEKEPVETRKARVGKSKKRKPGYFEPTKAVESDGMDMSPFPATGERVGQSKDRWNPVNRPLLYINFRSELSAFDKYLFFGSVRVTKTLKNKQDRLQASARRLASVMESGSETEQFRGLEMVKENRLLTEQELRNVCEILGKVYEEARLIRHCYYGRTEGISVRFRTGHAQYSEAFAGSGELAVVSLVTQLCQAERYSLVLLDEPEVSLHPGAQERLLEFLMSQCVKGKHQVIFTTHSPSLVRALPRDAIKVFYEREDGRFEVIEQAHPYAAFRRLGAPVPGKVTVYVEDRLAQWVVELAITHHLEQDDQGLFEVVFLPGGATTYFSHRVSTLMHHPNAFLLLDGDQRRRDEIPDPSTIPTASDERVEEIIKEATGCNTPHFGADGGDDPGSSERRSLLRRRYLGFLSGRLRFLPRSCPEEIVLCAMSAEWIAGSSEKAKESLRKLTKEALGSDSSSDIDNFGRTKLSENAKVNRDLAAIAVELRQMIAVLKPESVAVE